MKVYVTAAPESHVRARRAMDALRAAGHEVTHDWTADLARWPANDAPPRLRAQIARQNLDGVVTADALLVLTSPSFAHGSEMWTAMGGALVLGRPVVIAGPQRDRAVFCDLALARVDSDAEAIEAITKLGGAA